MSETLAESASRPAVHVRQAAPGGVVALPAAAWLAVLAVALATRPLLPVDETRYASVAWEMWRTGSYLVPQLNGHPYSDKPPLLFWLVTAGWSVLGPAEWWARLVGPICAAVSLLLTAVLARRLWPHRPSVALAAPVVLAGTVAWSVYSTLLLFDALLTACVLLGLIGIVEARRGRRRGFVLFALGVGLGVLAKGPVILLHLVPAAAAARWWSPPRVTEVGAAAGGPPRRRWGLALSLAGVAGALIALAWAVPAAAAGGGTYGRSIFLGQTTGRMVKSFAHRRPFWWYAPNLLWMTLPWWLWPAVWRRVRANRAARRPGAPLISDCGLRFCVVWGLGALAAFTLVSGKQVHYLLPELAAFALAVSRLALADESPSPARSRVTAPGVARASVLATGTLLVVIAAHLIAAPTLAARFDLRDVAAHLAEVERSGAPIAHQGRYAGEFTYLGRLARPITEVPADSISAWLAAHPSGRAVTYSAVAVDARAGGVELARPYWHRYLIVRRAPP